MRPRLLILTLLVTLLAASTASAAGTTYYADEAQKGALLFSLGGITAAPGALDDIGIGARWRLNNGMALRLGAGLLKHSYERKISPGSIPKVEQTGSLIGLEGGVEITLFRSAPVLIYTGGIGQLAYTSSQPNDKLEITTTRLTLSGVLGATYFFTKGVSLGAEYRLGLLYDSETNEDSSGDKTVTEDEVTTDIGVGSVGFILGFWF